MRSEGTRQTQGINGDAAALVRKYDVALSFAAAGRELPAQPCPYPRHRDLGRDWPADGGRLVCGYCHPPARRAAA
jgi:hypothetical protein